MMKRHKIIFENEEALDAAMAAESDPNATKVINRKRHSVAVERSPTQSDAEFSDKLGKLEHNFNARVVEDFQYELDDADDGGIFVESTDSSEASLDEVIDAIKAREAWTHSRGEGVSIAVVDTGIDGSRPEFPDWKRAGSWQPQGDAPWTDWEGHGTMCACIAAGTKKDGGIFDGVAPDAKIIACKTRFFDTELGAIYDFLINRAEQGEMIVATNSFGRKTGTAPTPPSDSDFIAALDDAIGVGIHVFFSAGNNHQRAQGDPAQCEPNSIWLHKSRADVTAVATCDLDEQMWFYSSRGPGQHFGQPDTSHKPDVTAPTPRNGRIVMAVGCVTCRTVGERVVHARRLPDWEHSSLLLIQRCRGMTYSDEFVSQHVT